MADHLADLSSEHPPSSSLQSERGSQIYQQPTPILQKLETLKGIAGNSKGRHERHTIFERSQFYGLLLGLLPDILLLVEDGLSQIRPIPHNAMFWSTYEGIRDLRLRWALWQEDAFQRDTEAGSWASTVEFKRSTLCGVVLHKLSDIRRGLKAVTSELPLKCREIQFVLPVHFLAVQDSAAKVDTYLTPDFSCIAKYVGDMSPAIADLFDILPVLKEYDSAGSDGELATFRGNLLSIKQSILQDSAKLERKSVQQQSIPVRNKDGFPVREQDDRDSYVHPLSFQKTLEETMLEDLEDCLRTWDGIEDHNNMKTENMKNAEGYYLSVRKDIERSRMDSDGESSVTAAGQSSVTTAEDGQTHKGRATLFERYIRSRGDRRVADWVKISESQEESLAVVAKDKKTPSVVETMKNIPPDRRARIHRLLDEKNLAERIARHILPDIVKPTSPESSKSFLGKSDISEPLKPKKSRETLEGKRFYFEERLERRPPSQYRKKSTENRRDDKSLEEMTVRLLRHLDERLAKYDTIDRSLKRAMDHLLHLLNERLEEARRDDLSLEEWMVYLLRRLNERFNSASRDNESLKAMTVHLLQRLDESSKETSRDDESLQEMMVRLFRSKETSRDDESLQEMMVRLFRYLDERFKYIPKNNESLGETYKNNEFFEDIRVRSLDRQDERFKETHKDDESLEKRPFLWLTPHYERYKETYKDNFLRKTEIRLSYLLDGVSEETHRDQISLREMKIELLQCLKIFREYRRDDESLFEEMRNPSLRRFNERFTDGNRFRMAIDLTNHDFPVPESSASFDPWFSDDDNVAVSSSEDEI